MAVTELIPVTALEVAERFEVKLQETTVTMEACEASTREVAAIIVGRIPFFMDGSENFRVVLVLFKT